MPWKMDGDKIAMQDGKPIWIDREGKEAPFDAEHALSKIGELNGEAATKKRELREAQDKLKALDGIENPSEFLAAARKALETVKNLDDKKLIDAGEAEKVKAEIKVAMQAQIDAEKTARAGAEQALQKEMIGGSFARSKFISEKLAIPHDLVEARFGQNFKIEDGKVIALDQHGNKLFSREKPGDPAGFDEALGMLVDAYPYKDTILKGSGAGGSGAPNNGGGGGGGKRMPLSEFNSMKPKDRAAFMSNGGTVAE